MPRPLPRLAANASASRRSVLSSPFVLPRRAAGDRRCCACFLEPISTVRAWAAGKQSHFLILTEGYPADVNQPLRRYSSGVTPNHQTKRRKNVERVPRGALAG